MHGLGVFQWPDGRKYDGHYKHDKKEGFGVYTWAHGGNYAGRWHNGKQHGEGTYTGPDGEKVAMGTWSKGQFIA